MSEPYYTPEQRSALSYLNSRIAELRSQTDAYLMDAKEALGKADEDGAKLVLRFYTAWFPLLHLMTGLETELKHWYSK